MNNPPMQPCCCQGTQLLLVPLEEALAFSSTCGPELRSFGGGVGRVRGDGGGGFEVEERCEAPYTHGHARTHSHTHMRGSGGMVVLPFAGRLLA